MYCIKMSTTNLLRCASQSQQQMFYHRNHRNLLFLCHPFRTYHSIKTNNNAKCCLLLDNVANKKCILIHSRGLRYRINRETNEIEEITTNSSSPNSANDNDEAYKMNPEELASKFKSEYYEYIRGKSKRKTMFNRRLFNQFIKNFNNEYAKGGYKIEHTGVLPMLNEEETEFKFQLGYYKEVKMVEIVGFWKTVTLHIIVILLPLIFMLYLIWKFRPRSNVKPEHTQIVAQPSIAFDQFMKDYLPSGEIDIIFHYPEQNLLVVFLRPGALINGEPFNEPGLHVQLDESFRIVPPMALNERIQIEESRIGLSDSVQIITDQVEFKTKAFYFFASIFGTFLLLYFIVFLVCRFLCYKYGKSLFRVVPINQKEGMNRKK